MEIKDEGFLDYLETVANKSSEANVKKGYSWETPPAPIPEDQIAETLEADVAIIGGGISGLGAGARCTEKGLSVILIEKYKGLVARGAHVASLDSHVMRKHGVRIDKEQFARDWMRISGSRCSEDHLWLYINKSEAAFEWLCDLGGDDVAAELYGGYYKGPDFTEYAGTHVIFKKPESTKYKHFGGAMLMCEILQDVIYKGGNRIIRRTRAEQLEKNADGRVCSFVAKGEDGKYRRFKGNKAVILATGDVGGDPEMVGAFAPLGLKARRNGYYPPGLNTGDGHKMAYWAGGVFEPASWALSMHLIAYSLYDFFFLHVNRQGKRFMNEDTWVQAKAIRTAMQPQGDWAFSVFDSKWFQEVGERINISGGQFTEPLVALYGDEWFSDKNDVAKTIERYEKKGTCFKCDTIEGLAEKMEVPVETFKATVDRYNELFKLGKDLDYGKRSELLTSIDKPPYYALKYGPALLNVFGGMITDVKMHVLDRDNKPIPGLYAVGNVGGGFYGVDYPLLLNGNAHCRCLVQAREATDTILEDN